MKATVIEQHPAGCIVKVNKKHEDRYMTGCPFWIIGVPAEAGGKVVFTTGDIVACGPTLDKARRTLVPGC